MKKILINAALFCALITGLVPIQTAPGAADEWGPRPHAKRHLHLSYAAYGAEPGLCRVGWWQTLRYGHVRPAWGEWCW